MFCRFCGKELPDTAKFCGGCGHGLEEETGAQVQPKPQQQIPVAVAQPKKKASKAKGIIIFLIILLIVLILALTGLLMYKNGVFDELFSGGSSDTEEEDEDRDEEDDEEDSDDEDAEEDRDDDEAGGRDTEATVTTRPIEESVATPEPTSTPEPTAEPTPEPTPAPVVENTIHYYQFVVADVTWQEAAQRCRNNGGYLVNINSQEEYEYILSLIAEHNLGEVIWWLGGCRQEGSYDYTWIVENGNLGSEILNRDEKYLGYWLSGEPSFGDEQTTEQYITMFYHLSTNSHIWNDVPNDIISIAPFYSGKLGYICEYTEDPGIEEVGYILPASSYRYLDESELWGLSAEQCRIARNEIFARHGRKFADAELQAYFDACYWYEGTIEPDNFDSAVLNEFEIYNRDLIVEYEEKMGYR